MAAVAAERFGEAGASCSNTGCSARLAASTCHREQGHVVLWNRVELMGHVQHVCL